MQVRRIALPAVALVLAGGAALATRSWIDQHAAPTPPATAAAPSGKGVLVAAAPVATGQFLQPELARWQDWPDVDVPENYLVKGQAELAEIAGAVARHQIALGQPITRDAIVKPGERGFLAAVLEPGMRAVSVPIDEASGNAGLIFPGDHVDLIVTQTVGGGGEENASERRVSETVLTDIRVIAMGHKLNGSEAPENGGSPQSRTATLEVTPASAESVALAGELGKLALSLRSLAAEPAASSPAARDGSGITWDDDVAKALRPENQPVTSLALIRGRETQLLSIGRGGAS